MPLQVLTFTGSVRTSLALARIFFKYLPQFPRCLKAAVPLRRK